MFEALLKKLAELGAEQVPEAIKLILEALGVLHKRTEELHAVSIRAAEKSDAALAELGSARSAFDAKTAELAEVIESARSALGVPGETPSPKVAVAARGAAKPAKPVEKRPPTPVVAQADKARPKLDRNFRRIG